MAAVVKIKQGANTWLTLFCVFVVICAPLILWTISELRYMELARYFEFSEREDAAGNSSNLILRYRNLVDQKITAPTADTDLSDIRLLAAWGSPDTAGAHESKVSFAFMGLPARALINVTNLLAGQPPFNLESKEPGWDFLDGAYYYERKREYLKAVLLYEKAEGLFETRPTILNFINLHKGFCLALLGKVYAAGESLQRVIEGDPDGWYGYTAEYLGVLIYQRMRQEKTIDALPDTVTKSKKYMQILAFEKAVNTLNTIIRSKKTARLFYLRGRALEESGKSSEAGGDYQRAIRLNPNSKYARAANRRLYILGALFHENPQFREMARKNFEKWKDPFQKKAAKLEPAVDIQALRSFSEKTQDGELEQSLNELEKAARELTAKEAATMKTKKKVIETKLATLKPAQSSPNAAEDNSKISLKLLMSKKLSFQKRKDLIRKKYKVLDRIVTTGGDTLVGKIISKNAGGVRILTFFGPVKVKTSQIKEQSKVSSQTQ